MKRIIFVGKGGSGKDWAKEILAKHNYTVGVSHTTRPIREGEKNSINYYYVNEAIFMGLKDLGQFYETAYFEPGWYYGTSLKDFQLKQVFIMTPTGISNILPEDRKESLIVYIDIDEETRKERLAKRRDADTVERRLETDQNQFEGFNDWDICIRDPYFEEDLILGIASKLRDDYRS